MLWGAWKQPSKPDHGKDEPSEIETLAAHLKLGNGFQFRNVQSIVNALLLCETVYKVVDGGPELAERAINEIASHFGQLASLTGLQFTLPHVAQRFLLAESNDSLYVCFMGTKQLADIFVDLNIRQASLWEDRSTEAPLGILAHGGFMSRAEGVPVEALYLRARARRQRLVLCGHSMGGAVAMLCTIRLLYALTPSTYAPLITCIVFGSPAVGSPGLAKYVDDAGWARHFINFALPEDVVPRMLVTARAAPTAQEASPAAEPTVQKRWLPSLSEWLQPQWIHDQRPIGVDSALNNNLPTSTPATSLEGGKILTAQEDAVVSKEHILPAAGSIIDEPQQGSILSWLGRSLRVLQDASVLALSNIQQLLPSYPKLAHFSQLTYLRAFPEDVTLPTARRAARDVQSPLQRNGFLLAMHRMPAYRQRLLSLIQAVAPGLLIQKSALVMAAPTGNVISVVADLAPELGPARAYARIPPLPPTDASGSVIPARMPVKDAEAEAKQSAGSRWAWPQTLCRLGKQQRVKLLVSVSGVGLSSVTHAWGQTKSGSIFPAKIIKRPPQTVLSPRVRVEYCVCHPNVAAYIPPWLHFAFVRPNTNVRQIPHLLLAVELSLPVARELASESSQESNRLQIFLQTDYGSSAAAVQLRPHHVWLLARQDADAWTALMQHLGQNSAPIQLQQSTASTSAARGVQPMKCSPAPHVEETSQPVQVAISVQGSALPSLPLALIRMMRNSMQRLLGRAVPYAYKDKDLLQSYSAGIVYTAVGNTYGADLSSSCSSVELLLQSRLDRQHCQSSQHFRQFAAYFPALQHFARLSGRRHWQQPPDVLIILLNNAKLGQAGRDDHGHLIEVAAVRRLMRVAIPLGIDVKVLVGMGDDNTTPLDVNCATDFDVDGFEPAVDIIHSNGDSASEAAAIKFAVLDMRRRRTPSSGNAAIRAKL